MRALLSSSSCRGNRSGVEITHTLGYSADFERESKLLDTPTILIHRHCFRYGRQRLWFQFILWL